MTRQAEGRRTVTRADLQEAIYARRPGLSHQQARKLLDAALDEMSDALVRGEPIQLRTFGAFEVRRKREWLGRNPRTGAARRVEVQRQWRFLESLRRARKLEAEIPSIIQKAAFLIVF